LYPQRSSDLANLYRQFDAWGQTIGDENLAVWFWKRKEPLDDPGLAANVDVERSMRYCRQMKLLPSEGPFLVWIREYPDLSIPPPGPPGDRAVYKLGALSSTEITKLLSRLTDELVMEGKRPAPTTGSALPSSTSAGATTGFWMWVLESTQRSIIGFGCGLKVRFQTGFMSAELRGCATP
jgi:hypothetical protein